MDINNRAIVNIVTFDSFFAYELYNLTTVRYNGWFSEGSDPWVELNRSVYLAAQQRVLSCHGVSKKYSLEVSFINGLQNVRYSLSDTRPLRALSPHVSENGSINGLQLELNASLETWDQFAIVDALLASMGIMWLTDLDDAGENSGTWRLDNETVVNLASLFWKRKIPGSDSIESFYASVFSHYRFEQSKIRSVEWDMPYLPDDQDSDDWFDPRTLNITEASINELLTNITISTLTLGLQRGIVPVTTTVYQNIYQYSDRLNFFLPYSLCLTCAFIFMVIGLRALIVNKVPAKDGGFLQIMMSTRGRTNIEKLVLR